MSSESADATSVKSVPFEDITQKFFDACSELKEGECVFMPGHNFSTAVHAVELMHSKVDIGMERYVPPVNLRSLIDEKYFDQIDDMEVLTIIDATLSCYVAWIDGADICNSLYTNIFLAEPEDIVIPHLVLDTLAKIFQHIVPLTVAVIKTPAIAGEEDFIARLPFERRSICAWDTVMTQIGKIDELFRGSDNGPGKIDPIKRSICLRLQWLRLFVEVWYNCLPPILEEAGILYANPGFSTNHYLCQAVSTALRRTAILMCEDFATIRQGEEGTLLDFEQDGDFSWLRVFDPKYMKHVAPGGFPRRTIIPNRKKTLEALTTFSNKLYNAMLDMFQLVTSVENLFGILTSAGKDETTFLLKSIYQVLIQPIRGCIFGNKELNVLVKESIFLETKNIAFKEGSVISHSVKCQALIKELVDALCRPVDKLFHIMGMNNGKLRDELVVVIKSLSSTYPLADKLQRFIDEFKHGDHEVKVLESSKPVHNWISSFAVQLAKYYYELSFDLNMYHVNQFEIMFRAYAVVLLNRCESLGALINETEEILEKVEKAKKKDQKKIKELNAMLDPARGMHNDLRMRKEFAIGVFLASMAMRKSGFLASIYWNEESERLTLENRLRLVRNVPYLKADYDTCKLTMWDGRYATMATKFIWAQARAHFVNAQACITRTGIEMQHGPYKSILTITKKNIVVCNLANLSPERRVEWQEQERMYPLLGMVRH